MALEPKGSLSFLLLTWDLLGGLPDPVAVTVIAGIHRQQCGPLRSERAKLLGQGRREHGKKRVVPGSSQSSG